MQEFYGKLRYFSPTEVARLMGFKLGEENSADREHHCLPRCVDRERSGGSTGGSGRSGCRCLPFRLPMDGSRARELWGLLGNSLNPQVVGLVCEACELPLCQKRAM